MHSIVDSGICPTCGNEFDITTRNRNQKYCSRVCWTTSKISRKIVSETQIVRHKEWHEDDKYFKTKPEFKKICPVCQKEFIVQPSRLRRKHCSVSCAAKHKYQISKINSKGRFTKKGEVDDEEN